MIGLHELAGDVDTSGSSAESTAPDSAPIANPQNGRSMWVNGLMNALEGLGKEFLYLIASESLGLTKIGFSSDPGRRQDELQATSAFPLKLHAIFEVPKGTGPIFERLIHQTFAHKRSHGEWFLLD